MLIDERARHYFRMQRAKSIPDELKSIIQDSRDLEVFKRQVRAWLKLKKKYPTETRYEAFCIMHPWLSRSLKRLIGQSPSIQNMAIGLKAIKQKNPNFSITRIMLDREMKQSW